MSHLASQISSCRRCQFYAVEGRRGGLCQQLGVQVQGDWKPCQLAIPPFAPSWEVLEGIAGLHEKESSTCEATDLQNAVSRDTASVSLIETKTLARSLSNGYGV